MSRAILTRSQRTSPPRSSIAYVADQAVDVLRADSASARCGIGGGLRTTRTMYALLAVPVSSRTVHRRRRGAIVSRQLRLVTSHVIEVYHQLSDSVYRVRRSCLRLRRSSEPPPSQFLDRIRGRLSFFRQDDLGTADLLVVCPNAAEDVVASEWYTRLPAQVDER